VVPDESKRLSAIGAEKTISGIKIKTFQKEYPKERTITKSLIDAIIPYPDIYSPIPKPAKSDWLACHEESGQPFLDYLRHPGNKVENAEVKISSKQRNTLYLAPFGTFESAKSEFLPTLLEYARVFFCMEVEMLPVITLEEKNITSRINEYTKKLQLLTKDLMNLLQTKYS